MDDVVINVDKIYKSFILPHEKHTSLKSAFVHFYRRRKYEKQQALKDISFEVKKGEFFGIVGRNGSGKSTLLKILAGIYVPTKGHINVNGKLTPFIELGVGFNLELTGRENVYLNGSLLGFSRKEMQALYKDIVKFAELERFMDQKLKNYSSGMQVRLAFSIAIQAKSDILVLDEVLAVGDSAFQKKCFNYFDKLKREGTTVILVTHSMETVERYCDRAVLIDSGVLKQIGSPREIAQLYSDINTIESAEIINIPDNAYIDHGISVSLQVKDNIGNNVKTIKSSVENLTAEIEILSSKDIDNPSIGLTIFNSQDIPIFATNTTSDNLNFNLFTGKTSRIKYVIDNIFSNDTYRIALSIKNNHKTEIYYSNDILGQFISIGRKHNYALASPNYKCIYERN